MIHPLSNSPDLLAASASVRLVDGKQPDSDPLGGTDARPARKLHRHKRVKRKSRRHCVLLSYDGSGFAGFQRQPGRRTVEGTLLEALVALDLPTGLSYSGRTDAGVHALGQVVVLRLPLELAEETTIKETLASLAALLPPDIRIRAHASAPRAFHPRWSAEEKRYLYWLRLPKYPPPTPEANIGHGRMTEPHPAVFETADLAGELRALQGHGLAVGQGIVEKQATKGEQAIGEAQALTEGQGIAGLIPWEIEEPFDFSRFLDALNDLRHAPDLRGFTAHGAPFKNRPPLHQLTCQVDGALARLSFQGPGFGRYAIRHMVGCAVAVARGDLGRDACAVTALADVPYRGTRAPASALVLDSVRYPAEVDPFRVG